MNVKEYIDAILKHFKSKDYNQVIKLVKNFKNK